MNPQSAMGKPAPVPPEHEWAAIMRRDSAADGRFFYAVRTTGVYCRPSCPSKRPRRENVLLFATALSAEAAGYRACRRCGAESERARRKRAELIESTCRLIEASVQTPRLDRLASFAQTNKHHLLRTFKTALGMTPAGYHRWLRRKKLEQGLGRGESVDSAIYGAGYGSPSRVYERPARLLGMTPAVYARGAPRQTIRYGFATTEFGLLMVAATQLGICAIEFGRDREELLSLLQRRFVNAELIATNARLDAWISAIAAHVAEPVADLRLPLDVRGTAFQKKVWDELQRIPAGLTVSYSELARSLGEPRAARAVAKACACNPAAVLIPCHRVVGADGSLRGYRWGEPVKSRLLAKEKRALDSRKKRSGC